MPLLLLWLLTTLLGRPPGPPEPRATVYVFLADTCPISQGITPELRELYFRYARQGVGFGGVFPDPATSAAAVAAFAQTYRLPFVCSRDGGHRLTRRLGARVTPEAVVLAADGRTVLYRGRIDDGFVRLGQRRTLIQHHDLAAALAAIVAGQPVAVAKTEPVGCFIESLILR